MLAGEAALIRAVDQAWWPLWKPGVDRRTRPARFRRLGGGQLPALSAVMLSSACREIGLDKAPGEDGWTARCMDAWSSKAWDIVCSLLQLVEKTGRWPASLAGGPVCLLPKGGVGPSVADPLQARPVVLLPCLGQGEVQFP